MYTQTVMDHFTNPRNVGEIEDANGVGEVGNSRCGDIMKMYLKIEDGRIADVKFKTYGCGSAIATSISDIPFDGPCATTQVGLIDGEFIINPTAAQKKVSDLALTVASTREKVIMIEAGANEVPEDTMIEGRFKAGE